MVDERIPRNDTSAEALVRDLIALRTELTAASKSDVTRRTETLKAIIGKAKESAESNEAEYVFEVFHRSIGEFEKEMVRLRSELVRAIRRKEVAEERGRSKVRFLKWRMREKEAETLSQRREILAILEASGRDDLRDGIEAVFFGDVEGRIECVDVAGEGGGTGMTWRETVGRIVGALVAVCGGRRENRGGSE